MPGKGFSHTPADGQFRNYSSWGRTRQPKNIAGPHGTQATIAAADPAGAVGHITENQRFLHLTYVHAGGANAAGTITVWGFSHSIGAWGKIIDIRGADVEMDTVGGATQSQVFEISGIDKVYFQMPAVNQDANDEFYAACSTF